MLLVFAQFIDALLGELHHEHVYRDARHRVILRLHVRVASARRVLFVLTFMRDELARVRQWL